MVNINLSKKPDWFLENTWGTVSVVRWRSCDYNSQSHNHQSHPYHYHLILLDTWHVLECPDIQAPRRSYHGVIGQQRLHWWGESTFTDSNDPYNWRNTGSNDPYNLSNLSDSPNATDSNRSPFSLLQLVNMLILFFRFVCTNQLDLMKNIWPLSYHFLKKLYFVT